MSISQQMAQSAKAYRQDRNPTISIDTKKKEVFGRNANKRRYSRSKGQPIEVDTQDLTDKKQINFKRFLRSDPPIMVITGSRTGIYLLNSYCAHPNIVWAPIKTVDAISFLALNYVKKDYRQALTLGDRIV